jgi:hypothetical protein
VTQPDRIEDNRESTVGLGTFSEVLAATTEGYVAHRNLFLAKGIESKLIPTGAAFGLVNSTYGPELFIKLYSPDNFQKSVYGTYLQSSIIYCTIAGEQPPTLDNKWFEISRYLELRDKYELPYYLIPFPSEEEGEQLRQEVAIEMCALR